MKSEKAREILEERLKVLNSYNISTFEGRGKTKRDRVIREKQALQFLLKENEELRKRQLTKEEFRHILCEFPPSIAEDSQQPEWTQGEIDEVWDFITKKNKYILTEEDENIANLQQQNSQLKEAIRGFEAPTYWNWEDADEAHIKQQIKTLKAMLKEDK